MGGKPRVHDRSGVAIQDSRDIGVYHYGGSGKRRTEPDAGQLKRVPSKINESIARRSASTVKLRYVVLDKPVLQTHHIPGGR